MANPRQIVGFKELHVQRATFITDSSITFKRDEPYGTDAHLAPVKVTGEGEVGLCDDGDVPFGALERVEADGMAVVAYHGFVEFAGEAEYGSAVVADGSGGVREVDTEDGRGTAIHAPSDGTVIVFI